MENSSLFLVLLCSFSLMMCKNQEKMSKSAPEVSKSPCAQLIQDSPDDALLFVSEVKSKREQVASKKAEKESLIQLVQFFQSEFIEGRQADLFWESQRLGNQPVNTPQTRAKNEEFRKNWAEMSYEMIGSQHNQNAFSHRQKVMEDSTGYIAYNLLVVPENWIRNHWKESLTATDSSFYQKVKESKSYDEVMEMNIRQEPPCKNL